MRIDILSKNFNTWSYDYWAAIHLQQAFKDFNITTHLVSLKERDSLTSLITDPPDLFLTFNHLGFQDADLLLCDFLKVQQIVWLKGHVGEGLVYLKSPFGKVINGDRAFTLKTRHEKLFFLSHGVSQYKSSPLNERPFDLVCVGNLVDPQLLLNKWKEELPFTEYLILEKAVAFANEHQIYNSFELLTLIKNVEVTSYAVIINLENYLRTIRLIKMIESIKGYRIDIFGNHQGKDWLLRLCNHENVHLHTDLPFSEILTLYLRSKTVLVDGYEMMDGVPINFFHALMCGSLPLIAQTCYLNDLFGSHAFYEKGQWEQLNEKVSYFLSNTKEREGLVNQWQEKIYLHSWKERAKEFYETVSHNSH